jgi:hypothetical protein
LYQNVLQKSSVSSEKLNFFLQGSMMRQINTSIFRELHAKLTGKLCAVLPLFCARKTAGICICLPFAFCI